MTRKMSIKKIVIRVIIIFIVLTGITLAGLWNRYLNKYNLLRKFYTQQGQEVYLLGTIHQNHFNSLCNYSMADVLSVVEHVQADAVFIESREEYYLSHGVVDGPVDMSVVYSYCVDNDTPVEMIDWWVVDNSYAGGNTTSSLRDDNIFKNISTKLQELDPSSKVLIVCGAGHLEYQTKRFLEHGFERASISNKKVFFDNKEDDFTYPALAVETWDKRAYFYAYTYPELIEQDVTLDESIKVQFTGGNHDAFYQQQRKYCEMFERNELYEEW